MRIGVGLPFKDQRGLPLDAAGLGLRARWIEEAGLDAAWMGDASFRRLATWPDPMMWLLTVGAANLAPWPSIAGGPRFLLPADPRPPAASDSLGGAA